jgi:ethanolamine permease
MCVNASAHASRSIDFRATARIAFPYKGWVFQTFPAIEEETVVADHRHQHRGIAYQDVGEDYMHKRQLRSGAAGWILLAGLGVAYVISGDFAGWNFGLAEGGWGGLLIATILMGLMYTCMVFALAELSSTIPTAGGGYGFARRALGPWGGFMTGTAILIEYAIAPAAIVVFIGGYIESLDIWGIETGWPVYLFFYAIFVGIHLIGVGEALKVIFAITVIAVIALVVFVIGMIPEFSASNLTNIDPDPAKSGSSDFLPFGYAGVLAAFVYGIWFFLAIEGVPLAAEETRDPKRDMPKGIIVGMLILLLFAALMLTLAPGGAGSEAIMESDNPLPLAADTAIGEDSFVGEFVNYVGLAGLIASFFSIIFAYSRQLFALSRAGYLPKALSVTTGRRVPAIALIVPGIIGFALAAITEDGARMIQIAVFGATVSYVLMLLSHIVLRTREPNLERPYRTPGGVVTSGIGLVLAIAAVIAVFFVDETAAFITLGVYLVAVAYFALYSRHHLVARAPEEEFEAIERAEAELAGS